MTSTKHLQSEARKDEEVVTRILATIAEQTDTDVLDLPPLNDRLDTDALGTLVRSTTRSEIQFQYHGHDVVIDGAGGIRVSGDGN